MGSKIVPDHQPNKQPQQFEFGGHVIRALPDQESKPSFIAADVCEALEIGNVSMALSRLDDDEKGISTIDTLGGKQDVLTVNESGLFSLILTSRKPEAKIFKRWITHEVLPAIHKTGSYSLQALTPAEMILVQAQQLVAVERQMAELHRTQAEQAQSIEAITDHLIDADYYTVLQWCTKQRIRNTSSIRSKWGREATQLSTANNIEIKSAVEGPYSVGRYHKSILLQVCVAKPHAIPGQLPLLTRRTSGGK